jgi:hypothetical protein
MSDSRFREIWEESPDGQFLCALINGDRGWLMCLRSANDPGFSSRNPEPVKRISKMIEYRLNNGQVDEYPSSWSYPVNIVEEALQFFRDHGVPPPFIRWHNDSEDGVVLDHGCT